MKKVIPQPGLHVNLKYWRVAKALNIKDLAEIAKVSTSTICKIEKNPSRLPIPAVINRLSNALNVSIEDLILRDEKLAPKKKTKTPAA